MPSWTNQELVVYHGTDDVSAANIMAPAPPLNHGIQLAYCRPLADFGQAFYTTTYFHQAANWANMRCAAIHSSVASRPAIATILEFRINRELLGRLQSLVFLREDQPNYWDFVHHCRTGAGPHRSTGDYDAVYGPVSLWPQTLTLNNCDQISFNTDIALLMLPTPTVPANGKGTPLLPVI
jgi:Protein of unknown function (DUF3990)